MGNVRSPTLLALGVILPFSLHLISAGRRHDDRKISPEIQKAIDDYILNDVFLGNDTFGMGLSIVKEDGEVLYTTGYGMADIPQKIRNGNETQFLIGSVSKSFTAVLVVKTLHETFPELGDDVLDTPIRELIPEAYFTLVDRIRSEQATFRDLLSHSLCMSTNDLQAMAEVFSSTEELLRRSRYIPAQCDFRKDSVYSNQMVVIANVLAAGLLNKTSEEAMKELWTELGMHNTTFIHPDDDYSAMPYRTKPYIYSAADDSLTPYNIEMLKRVSYEAPAGGIITTPNDMLRYLRFHLGRGKTAQGNQLIPEHVYEWILQPNVWWPMFFFKEGPDADEQSLFTKHAYGLAISLSSYDGWEYIEHGGTYATYRNHLSIFPQKKVGIFTSMNMSPLGFDNIKIHWNILEMLEGNLDNHTKKVDKVMSSSSKTEQELFKEKAKKQYLETLDKFSKLAPTPVMANMTGVYGSGSLGELEISERFNEATNQTEYYLEYGKWAKGWLHRKLPGIDLFGIEWETDIDHDARSIGFSTALDYLGRIEENVKLHMLLYEGQFRLGLRSEDLPEVPWDPESC